MFSAPVVNIEILQVGWFVNSLVLTVVQAGKFKIRVLLHIAPSPCVLVLTCGSSRVEGAGFWEGMKALVALIAFQACKGTDSPVEIALRSSCKPLLHHHPMVCSALCDL